MLKFVCRESYKQVYYSFEKCKHCGVFKTLLCIFDYPDQQQWLNQWHKCGAGQSVCPTNGRYAANVLETCWKRVIIFGDTSGAKIRLVI